MSQNYLFKMGLFDLEEVQIDHFSEASGISIIDINCNIRHLRAVSSNIINKKGNLTGQGAACVALMSKLSEAMLSDMDVFAHAFARDIIKALEQEGLNDVKAEAEALGITTYRPNPYLISSLSVMGYVIELANDIKQAKVIN